MRKYNLLQGSDTKRMSRRRNKQNRISALIRKQSGKCLYEKGGIHRRMLQVDDLAVELVIKTAKEALQKNPYDLYAKGKLASLKAIGLIKESPEAGTSRDSSNF